MIAARAAGVPAPELHDHGDGALGQAYLLMERLDGETIPRRLLRDDAYAAARPGLARRLGEVLARIHQVDPDTIPGLPNVDALGQLKELYQAFAEPRPALEIGLRWLAEHRPAPVAGHAGPRRLPHRQPDGRRRRADRGAGLGTHPPRRPPAGPGLAVHQGLAVRLAAPRRRLRRPGRPDGRATRPAAAPRRTRKPSAGGSCTAPSAGALLCRRQAERYLAEAEPSIELAVLGRRVCEQEWDILLALGHAAPSDRRRIRWMTGASPAPFGPMIVRTARSCSGRSAGSSRPRPGPPTPGPAPEVS